MTSLTIFSLISIKKLKSFNGMKCIIILFLLISSYGKYKSLSELHRR